MKKILRYALLFASAAALTTACEDNKGEGGNEPPASTLTPDQHKVKLENIGKELAGYFSAEEDRAALESLQELLDLTAQDDEMDSMPMPMPAPMLMHPFAQSLAKALRSMNPATLLSETTRAAVHYSIAGELGSNGMTYTYDYTAEEWLETPTDERRITAVYGRGTGASTLEMTYSAEKTDYAYTPDDAVAEVPASIRVTLTVNGKTELTLDVRPNLSNDGLTVKPEAAFTHGSLACSAQGEANPQFITATGQIVKNGTTLVDAYAKVAVSDMTDLDNWICEERDWDGSTYEYIDPSDHFADFVKTGECRMRVLSAEIVGNGDIRKIIDLCDKIEKNYTQEGAEAEAAVYNANMNIYLAYTDDNTKAANVVMDVSRDEWETYDWATGAYTTHYEYYADPVLVFGDGSKYAFESYFTESRFSSLFDTIEELADAYSALIR